MQGMLDTTEAAIPKQNWSIKAAPTLVLTGDLIDVILHGAALQYMNDSRQMQTN